MVLEADPSVGRHMLADADAKRGLGREAALFSNRARSSVVGQGYQREPKIGRNLFSGKRILCAVPAGIIRLFSKKPPNVCG
jgi:hypothetical protein